MKRLFYVIPLVCLLCFAFGCQKQGDEVTEDEVLKAITESYSKHVAAHKRQDAAEAAAIYAEDVWVIGEDGSEVKSRKEFEAMYAQMYKSGAIVKELRYVTEELTVGDGIAVEMGWYSVTIESQGQEEKSKYSLMVLWQRQQDDSWKIYRGMDISAKESE